MKNIELIDDFFAGKLTEKQQLDFEKELISDAELKASAKDYLSAKIANRQEVYEEKKKQFAELHKSISHKKQTRTYFTLGGAAAAVIIVFFAWFMLLDTSTPNEYTQNYIKQNLSTLPSQMSANIDSLNLGVDYYNKANYKAALQVFNSLPQTSKNIEYQGLCYLQNKQYDQALLKFQQLTNEQDIINNKGGFYQSLTLILQGKNEQAKQKLEQFIKETESETTKKQAKELLELL